MVKVKVRVVKVESVVALVVKVKVKALVVEMTNSVGCLKMQVGDVGLKVSYVVHCFLLSTLQSVTLPYYITTMLLHYLVVHCSCSTLYYITVYYIILYCIATLYFVTLLHYLIALQCTALQCVGSFYNGCSLLHYLVTL